MFTEISYTRIRETFIEALKAVGLSWRNYGVHSLRSEGAMLAAKNRVPDRLFKHGKWKFEKAKDGYIDGNLSSLLLVSKNLIK